MMFILLKLKADQFEQRILPIRKPLVNSKYGNRLCPAIAL